MVLIWVLGSGLACAGLGGFGQPQTRAGSDRQERQLGGVTRAGRAVQRAFRGGRLRGGGGGGRPLRRRRGGLGLALRRAVGDRIVRVITGKGIGSPGEPVLKAAVVAWCAGEGADVVREWAPERERDGCYGALILALRPR